MTDDEILKNLETEFIGKREEFRSNISIIYAIVVAVLSVVLFAGVFIWLLQPFIANGNFYLLLDKLAYQDFINNQFVTVVSLSLTAGLIPPIIYAMARLLKTKQRNAELASINLDIRHYRNRLMSTRQKEVFGKISEKEAEKEAQSIANYLRRFLNLLNYIQNNSQFTSEDIGITNIKDIPITEATEIYREFRNKQSKLVPLLGGKVVRQLDLIFSHMMDFIGQLSANRKYRKSEIENLRRALMEFMLGLSR
jgi:hypothetical protein